MLISNCVPEQQCLANSSSEVSASPKSKRPLVSRPLREFQGNETPSGAMDGAESLSSAVTRANNPASRFARDAGHRRGGNRPG